MVAKHSSCPVHCPGLSCRPRLGQQAPTGPCRWRSAVHGQDISNCTRRHHTQHWIPLSSRIKPHSAIMDFNKEALSHLALLRTEWTNLRSQQATCWQARLLVSTEPSDTASHVSAKHRKYPQHLPASEPLFRAKNAHAGPFRPRRHTVTVRPVGAKAPLPTRTVI